MDNTTSGGLDVGALLGKAFETGLDIATKQLNPVENSAPASTASKPFSQIFAENKTAFLGGGAALLIVIVLLVFRRR